MVRRGDSSSEAVLFLDTCIDYVAYDNVNHQYTRSGFVVTRKSNDKRMPIDMNGEPVPQNVLSFDPLPDVIRAN
jgi:hypothetical protein